MRKILAFLVLLMLPWAARGQALADWYYWFDMEEVPHESGSVSNQQFQIPVDVSHLDWGLHTLYVQVKDTAGVYSTPHGEVFYNIPANGQRLSNFCYWFDGDIDVKELPYNQGCYNIDITGLNPGFHFINYYVKDELGGMTGFKSSGFYRMPMLSRQKLNYWFSGDATAIPVADYRDGFIIDVTRLQEGFNTIYFQMEDNGPTDIQSYNFIKVPQTENAGDMTLVCIIDGQVVGEEKVAAHGGVVKCDMDVSNIEVGMHKAMFQLISPSGAGSSIAETYFIRTLTNDDIASMQCSYTIDGMHNRVHKGTCTNGVFHFDLPVDEVEDGLHRIDFMLIAENGATTTQGNAWFFKTPVGGNAIKQYDYWLNDKSDEVHSVTLDEPKDPFQLIKLLPVDSEPIRSSCFHFENKDNNPMMYAKNDIHFRFHDKSGRWVDDSKQYVDYNVSEAVTDIEDMKYTQTFERPEDNGIKWFKFEAEEGDTIAFRGSQATSIQVFDPSGEEIYSASGDKSVKYGGAHTWEDGTYYVAVHDVTGSKPNVTLDYMHMDRYDVVAQDVHVVGNGGCSTITFQGNGFRNLYKVDLYTAQGDTIHSIDVGHESDASTTVTFDFTGAELGKYNALFHFTEEDKTFANNITVEEAKDIELITKVSYPSTFLRGTSVTYTVEITNKGNMTAYNVPLYTFVQTMTENGISYIKYFGMDYPNVFDEIEDVSIEEKEELLKYGEEFGDDAYFLKGYVHSDVKDSVMVRTNYSFISIPAYGTRTFNLQITADEEVEVWVTLPENWLVTNASVGNAMKSAQRRSRSYPEDYFCCYKETVECFLEQTSIAMDVMSPLLSYAALGSAAVGAEPLAAALEAGSLGAAATGCGASLRNDQLKVFGETLCGSNKSLPWRLFNAYFKSQSAISVGTVLNCLGLALGAVKIDGLEKKAIQTFVGGKLSTVSFFYDLGHQSSCDKKREKKPGCPPTPPKGGTSTPRNSCEPNDIRGYTAESGSTFMRDDVEEVTYIIDSENDPVFADAPAHTVIITDTICGEFYDLTSLSTRNITIGDVSMDLDGTEQNFIKTMDLRPRLNVIAQVEQKYDPKTGIAKWIWTSLDPMTMEPTDDVMQGVLPVNDESRNGEGHITYRLKQKTGLPDGTKVTNQADIIFDYNDPVSTPVWTNTIDAVSPSSRITNVFQLNDTIATIAIEGSDERSGVWKYDVYVQYGEDAPWVKMGECSADSARLDFRYYDGMDYGFCVLATDSAGNVEQKELKREGTLLKVNLGDVNSDGRLTIDDITLTIAYYLGQSVAILEVAADMDGDGKVTISDITDMIGKYLEAEARRRLRK